MNRLAVAALMLLAACGTPQQQCIARETRELRTIDRLIAETQGNLDRGYAIETVLVTEEVWDWCFDPRQPQARPGMCWKDQTVQEQRPKAIDLAEEARKLDGLRQKRAELDRAAAPAIAACKAAHPE